MLNLALVGCGKIAKKYSYLSGGNLVKNIRLVAVCDQIKEKAEAIATQYAVPSYTDIHKMMQKENIDIVAVLTPSGLHAALVLHLTQYKKHIIVEKPLALTLEDADAMIRACDSNGIKLFVANQNRFNIPIMALREAIDADRFGKMVMGTVRIRWCRTQAYYDQDEWRGTWAFDGGVLTNQASHHIDMLVWMMGDVESVFARSITALVDIEVEDTAAVVLKFRNGALGIIEATTATRPKDLEGSLSILGEKGSVEIGGFAMDKIKTWQFEDATSLDTEILESQASNPADVTAYGHSKFLEHVVSVIENHSHSLIDGLEGRKSLELITAIYESIETGNEINLRFIPKQCKLGHV